MKKIVMAGALAASVTVGLVAAPKAEASSAKYTINHYRTVKKYKHGMKATFSYQLPQLKGKSAAVKKINKNKNNVYFKSSNLKKMNFVLKKGKVYVYPQVYGYNMDKYFTLPSRYK